MDKPILKARYLEQSGENLEEDWEDISFDSNSNSSLSLDFHSLVEREQERFLEYSDLDKGVKTSLQILIEREIEFTKRIEKLAGYYSRRKKLRFMEDEAPSLSPLLKRSFSNISINSAMSSSESQVAPPKCKCDTPRTASCPSLS